VDLRQELLPPVVEQSRIDEIGAEITRIADLVHYGPRSEADAAMAAFNAAAGCDYGIGDFLENTTAHEAWRTLPARPRDRHGREFPMSPESS